MIIKCEKCGKQWVHKREDAYIAPFCSHACAHSSELKRVRRTVKPPLTEDEYRRQQLIDHPDFLEVD